MIQLPKMQFRLSTGLLAVAVAALWLGCLHHPVLAVSLPRFALLLVLLGAMSCLVHCEGEKRAFSLGFVMLAGIYALRPSGLISKDDTDWLFNAVLIHLSRWDRAVYIDGLVETSRFLVAALWGVLGGIVSLAMYLRWHARQ